jgi:hypothetical protein
VTAADLLVEYRFWILGKIYIFIILIIKRRKKWPEEVDLQAECPAT